MDELRRIAARLRDALCKRVWSAELQNVSHDLDAAIEKLGEPIINVQLGDGPPIPTPVKIVMPSPGPIEICEAIKHLQRTIGELQQQANDRNAYWLDRESRILDKLRVTSDALHEAQNKIQELTDGQDT